MIAGRLRAVSSYPPPDYCMEGHSMSNPPDYNGTISTEPGPVKPDRFQLERANAALHERRRQRRRTNTAPPGAFALAAPPAAPAPRQLELAIEYAPQRLRDHGYRDAHRYPLVSPDVGKVTRSYRVPAPQAWNHPRLEMRAGNSWPCLTVDCDGAESVKRLGEFVLDERLPEPNVIVQRRASGNVHATYMVDPPVHRPCDARVEVHNAPLRLAGRVVEYLTAALGGDPGFPGVLTLNPEWAGPEFHTDYLRARPWTLRELNAAIPAGWRIPDRPLTAIGRNVALFRWAVKEAHRPRAAELIAAAGAPDCPAWLAIVQARHDGWYGRGGLFGLPASEVRGIAMSAARYSIRQYSPARFRARQAARGKASGAHRREAVAERDRRIRELVDGGDSQRAVAAAVGVHEATVSRALARTITASVTR
jgi:hypothetical protein